MCRCSGEIGTRIVITGRELRTLLGTLHPGKEGRYEVTSLQGLDLRGVYRTFRLVTQFPLSSRLNCYVPFKYTYRSLLPLLTIRDASTCLLLQVQDSITGVLYDIS